jgi:sigma-B regulation protein RsbU (phosphoserine phosphatase)
VSDPDEPFEESPEELFENAPCGYLTTRIDGTILRVNRTFEDWTGLRRESLLGKRRFDELLTPGGRIYHETHYAPLLHMQGAVREIALEIVCADGSRLPALVNSVVREAADGSARVVRTTVFDATDRRRYERELLQGREREREIALELQRSLLAGELPSDDGIRIEVHYRPAVRGLEVGGDWYDAFWLASGRTCGVVVGDVVGRGIGAAATMGQLRSAARALASTGLGPGPLLDALDRFAHRHDIGLNTTLVCAELNLTRAELRWACAGHPPPLFFRSGSPACFLWEGRSAPLDAYVGDAPAREEGTTRLEPGDALLLYTDGLIERRGATIDEGMERLLEEAETHRNEPAEGLASGVFRALRDAEHDDDICLLTVRVKGLNGVW